MRSTLIHLPTHWPALSLPLDSTFPDLKAGSGQPMWLQVMITQRRSALTSHSAPYYGSHYLIIWASPVMVQNRGQEDVWCVGVVDVVDNTGRWPRCEWLSGRREKKWVCFYVCLNSGSTDSTHIIYHMWKRTYAQSVILSVSLTRQNAILMSDRDTLHAASLSDGIRTSPFLLPASSCTYGINISPFISSILVPNLMDD